MTEKKRLIVETVVMVTAFGLALVCALAHVPGLRFAAPLEMWLTQQQNQRQLIDLAAVVYELQAKNTEAQAELARISQVLETTVDDMAWLEEGYDAVSTQVTTTNSRLSDLNRALGQTQAQTAEVEQFLSFHKIVKERDEALAQAERNAEQIRQLTLKLHRAGVYP